MYSWCQVGVSFLVHRRCLCVVSSRGKGERQLYQGTNAVFEASVITTQSPLRGLTPSVSVCRLEFQHMSLGGCIQIFKLSQILVILGYAVTEGYKWYSICYKIVRDIYMRKVRGKRIPETESLHVCLYYSILMEDQSERKIIFTLLRQSR